MISHIRITDTVRSYLGNGKPRNMLVLGSGLSTVVDIIVQPTIFAQPSANHLSNGR